MRRLLAAVGIAGAMFGIALGMSPMAAATETCAAHLAREGVSEAVDIAEHRANPAWRPSPCDTGESAPSNGAAKREESKPEEPEGKSRFCRKHWIC
jgi:hypothetical protein